MTLLPSVQFYCCDCERDFKTERALRDHLHSSIHNPQLFRCKDCDREFRTARRLKQHLTSLRHVPLCHVKCVASVECKKMFRSPSAQLHHLESGSCKSGMTKEKLNEGIAAMDTERIITRHQVPTPSLLQDTASTASTSSSPILTPTSTEFLDSYPSTAILTPVSELSSLSLASSLTFQPGALHQHVSPGAHAAASEGILFHCPLALVTNPCDDRPPREFAAVSSLAQHIESGACHGGKETFSLAIEYLQQKMEALGLGGLKLMN